MTSTSLTETKQLLEQYGLSPLKKLGQNFLVDSNIIKKIVDCIPIDKTSNIIEIGPGLGALTKELAEKAGHIVSIDIDSGMVKVLNNIFNMTPNVSIVHADILKTDLNKIADYYFKGQNYHICGNLPYYITAKCLLKACESNALSITAMVQKEVADRIVSRPGTKDYGVLSASIAYYTNPETMFHVSKNCFYPAPDVESTIIKAELTRPVLNTDRNAYISVIKGCFAQRRKTIFNNMVNSFKTFSKDQIKQFLYQLNIPETARAEQISPEQFALLSDLIYKNK